MGIEIKPDADISIARIIFIEWFFNERFGGRGKGFWFETWILKITWYLVSPDIIWIKLILEY